MTILVGLPRFCVSLSQIFCTVDGLSCQEQQLLDIVFFSPVSSLTCSHSVSVFFFLRLVWLFRPVCFFPAVCVEVAGHHGGDVCLIRCLVGFWSFLSPRPRVPPARPRLDFFFSFGGTLATWGVSFLTFTLFYSYSLFICPAYLFPFFSCFFCVVFVFYEAAQGVRF